MERWLNALERRFGRYLPGNLTYWLVGLMGATFLIEYFNPGFYAVLVLDPEQVMRGQVWRLFTYLLIPPSPSVIWVVFALLFFHQMGTTLERDWGAAKYLVWWLVGMIGTTIFAFAFRLPADNHFLLMSLFLAYATLYPDTQIRLFFIIPVAVKWLALLDAIGLLYMVVALPGLQKLLPLVAVGNYLLFFTPTLASHLRGFARRGARTGAKRPSPSLDEVFDRSRVRRCALCGATDEDRSVDIRVCSCEKCGKPTEFCLPHARNH